MESNLKYLRKSKGEFLESVYDIFMNNQHPLQVTFLSNALIIPPTSIGEWHGRVEGLSEHSVPEVNISETFSGKTLYCGYLNSHWGHFITDSLPQLWPLFQNENRVCDLSAYDRILFVVHKSDPQNLTGNIYEAFRLLGILDKVRLISEPAICEETYVAEQAWLPREMAACEMLGVFDAIANAALAEGEKKINIESLPKKIYLSRAKLPKARLNEPGIEWLDNYFEANGYHVIYPERMSLTELVCYVRMADSVAAMSGTLPHLMMFGESHSKLIIIEKYAATNNYQPGVDILKNLNVTRVDANALLRTVSAGLGPFIIYPNEIFCRYAKDTGMSAPRRFGKQRLRKLAKVFFRTYARHYARRWELPEWEYDEIRSLGEAYEDSRQDFGAWLDGTKYMGIEDFLYPRRIAKILLQKFHRR